MNRTVKPRGRKYHTACKGLEHSSLEEKFELDTACRFDPRFLEQPSKSYLL